MINPVAFSLGSLQIRWYGILLALGFLVGYVIIKKFAKEKKLPPDLVDDFFVWVIPLGIVGARVFEVIIYEPTYYFADPIKMLYVWQGGLSSHGGMLGAVVATIIVAKKYKINFYAIADLLPIPFFLGAALGRIGNFINNELVGKVTSVPWAVVFNGYDGLRHPSQVYEALKNVLLGGIAFQVKKTRLPEGCMFWFGLGSYSLFRFVVELWKDLPTYVGLTIAQWISVPLLVISFIMFYKQKQT